jgi:hypothetical protein
MQCVRMCACLPAASCRTMKPKPPRKPAASGRKRVRRAGSGADAAAGVSDSETEAGSGAAAGDTAASDASDEDEDDVQKRLKNAYAWVLGPVPADSSSSP